MDYIKQMKGFRERRKTHPLSANAVAMYLVLIEEAYTQGFPVSFPVSHAQVQQELSLYDRNFRKAREDLVQEGYIAYKPGNRRTYGLYSLVPLEF